MTTLHTLFNKAQKPKFYAVVKGRKSGIFPSWDECKEHVNEYPGAVFKGFKSHEECEKYLRENKDIVEEKPMAKPLLEPDDYNTEDLQLSAEQFDVFQHYKSGHNIFMTGPGGTGKSKLIQHIYNDAKANKLRIQVCAMTGCAAVLLNCNAKTVHSWAGIGLGKGDQEDVVRRVCGSKYRKVNWVNTDLLILDEVSMLSVKLFELLNYIGQRTRKSQRPFGGMQVIFSGDFYQLPPVGDTDDELTWQFCFQSEIWNEVFQHQIRLKTMFRQRDPVYVKILNQIREGKISKNSYNTLMTYVDREKDENSTIKPTILLPTRKQVDRINEEAMKCLDEEPVEIDIEVDDNVAMTEEEKLRKSLFSHDQISHELNYLKTNLLCEEKLVLKKGAQVMCVANIEMEGPEAICNGSQGIIVDFVRGFPLVEFNNKVRRVMGRHSWASETIPGVAVTQVPLILAWAITIHKSQGATLDVAEIDIGSGIFECGQTYVALSRLKSLDGLYLQSFNPGKILVNKTVKQFYSQF